MGVDVQAVAVAVYQYYYWADPELGAKVARIINEEFVEATSRYPGRFLPLGTVPLQDTTTAVAELRYLASRISACAASRSAPTSKVRRSPAHASNPSGPRSRPSASSS